MINATFSEKVISINCNTESKINYFITLLLYYFITIDTMKNT